LEVEAVSSLPVTSSIAENAQDRLQKQLSRYLPSNLASEISRHQTSVTYAANATLCFKGSSAEVIFWIISGIAKVYCPVPKGSRILVRLAQAGEVLGYPHLEGTDGRPLQPFEAQALTKCTVAMFSRDNLMRTIERLDQPVLVRFLEHLSEAWSMAAYRIVTFLGYSFRQRLELALQDLAHSFGAEDERGTLLVLKLSHMDLAEMIGSSRPMVTVLIGEMLADGSLCRQGQHQYLIPRRRLMACTPNALPR
jgi:CRP/FNR family transcriptional regulator, cyclic AMP receptor protein